MYKRKMSHVLSKLLVVVLPFVLLLLSSCAPEEPIVKEPVEEEIKEVVKDYEDILIGVSSVSFSGDFYVSTLFGIADEAEKLGLPSPIMLEAGGYDYLDRQLSQLDDLAARGVDAIIVMPISYEGTVPTIDSLAKRGIYVVELSAKSASKLTSSKVHVVDYNFGVEAAHYIGHKFEGKGKGVILAGPAGASWAMDRVDGFVETIKKEYPTIEILGMRHNPVDAGIAMNDMADFIETFPEIDFVFPIYHTYALGATRAIEAAGREEIVVATVGVNKASLEMLQNKRYDMVLGEKAVLMGREALRQAVRAVRGEPTEFDLVIPTEVYTWETVKDWDINKIGPEEQPDEIFPEGWVPR
jgi:ABC-type sugar transport system substrate-binding protein